LKIIVSNIKKIIDNDLSINWENPRHNIYFMLTGTLKCLVENATFK
jgi:hypothetical protein